MQAKSSAKINGGYISDSRTFNINTKSIALGASSIGFNRTPVDDIDANTF